MDYRDTVEVKVEGHDDWWRVSTSVNGNGWWGIGVTFTSRGAAESVAAVIAQAARDQGDRVL